MEFQEKVLLIFSGVYEIQKNKVTLMYARTRTRKKIRPVVACIFSHTRPTNANIHRDGGGYNNIGSSIEQLPIFFQDLT